jgi:hypothetical protein
MSKNLMHQHPSEDVRVAMVRLADALCMWERGTGNNNLVIVKDTTRQGYEYRALSGAEIPKDVADALALEMFDNLNKHNA